MHATHALDHIATLARLSCPLRARCPKEPCTDSPCSAFSRLSSLASSVFVVELLVQIVARHTDVRVVAQTADPDRHVHGCTLRMLAQWDTLAIVRVATPLMQAQFQPSSKATARDFGCFVLHDCHESVRDECGHAYGTVSPRHAVQPQCVESDTTRTNILHHIFKTINNHSDRCQLRAVGGLSSERGSRVLADESL
jgi:hypothetical protein